MLTEKDSSNFVSPVVVYPSIFRVQALILTKGLCWDGVVVHCLATVHLISSISLVHLVVLNNNLNCCLVFVLVQVVNGSKGLV